jgi:hypothetical protein
MKRHWIRRGFCVIALLAGPGSAIQLPGAIFNETFDPLLPGGSVQLYYSSGNATGWSVGVVPGVGVGGTAGLQLQLSSSGGFGGAGSVAAQYLNQAVSGNTSLNPSDYTLSFDAKGTGGLLLYFQIQTWDGQNSSGNYDGTITETAGTGLLSSSFQNYSLNLGTFTGSLSGQGVAGGTYAISFEFVVTDPPPYSESAVVDNLEVTMVPEPGTFALLGLGAFVVAIFLRSRGADCRPSKGC